MSAVVSPLPVTWRDRPVPLSPSAVVGLGAAAGGLLRRVSRSAPDALASFEGAAAPGVLVVLGEADRLPWADGVGYLGRDPRAPALLLPTALEPSVHPALLEQAIRRRLASSWRVAVLADPPRLISLASPRPLTPQALAALEAKVRG